jgi:hypothetical protein
LGRESVENAKRKIVGLARVLAQDFGFGFVRSSSQVRLACLNLSASVIRFFRKCFGKVVLQAVAFRSRRLAGSVSNVFRFRGGSFGKSFRFRLCPFARCGA